MFELPIHLVAEKGSELINRVSVSVSVRTSPSTHCPLSAYRAPMDSQHETLQ